MESDIQKAIETGKITQEQAPTLEKLQPGAYCTHRSWGFGRIAEWNVLINQITIDFQTKKGHQMQLGYAAESLDPLPDDHILAQVASDPAAVKKQAATDPLGVVRTILISFGGAATQDKITSALVPRAMSDAEFKKWWLEAKKKLKKDGHFLVPAKRTEPFELREDPVSPSEELLTAFRSSNQLKTRITALNEILKNLSTFKEEPELLKILVTELDELVAQSRKLHKTESLELAIAAAELREEVKGIEPLTDETISLPSLVSEMNADLGELLEAMPAAKQKYVLTALKAAAGDVWVDRALNLMRSGSIRINGEIARTLMDQGHEAELRSALDRWIRERSISSSTLYWLCKERKKNFGDLIQPSLLSAILSSLERDQFDEKRSNKLQDFLNDDKDLIPDLVRDADRDTAREVMRRMLLSPVFEELTKRSLLARIIKLHPSVEDLLEEQHGEQQQGFIVSWSSLRTKKSELEDLVNKQIPANIKEIQIAREYGDLRENFEFKAAKETQRVLGRRRVELEQDLSRARGTNFENPDTSVVSIGTVVTIQQTGATNPVEYTILGAWDSDPSNNIISYLTAIGQALLGKKIGEVIDIPDETGSIEIKVLEIKACAPEPELEEVTA